MANNELPEAFLRFVTGKTVALVGNAESLLQMDGSRDAIESHDIVVRMNRAVAVRRELQERVFGTRCEVYCYSGAGLSSPTDFTVDKPKWAFWMTTFQRELAPAGTLFYPETWWLALRERLTPGSRPSTGLMAFDMFYSYTDAAHITLFGYDFWETKTFYVRTRHVARTHKPTEEQNLILSTLTDERVSLWRKSE